MSAADYCRNAGQPRHRAQDLHIIPAGTGEQRHMHKSEGKSLEIIVYIYIFFLCLMSLKSYQFSFFFLSALGKVVVVVHLNFILNLQYSDFLGNCFFIVLCEVWKVMHRRATFTHIHTHIHTRTYTHTHTHTHVAHPNTNATTREIQFCIL